MRVDLPWSTCPMTTKAAEGLREEAEADQRVGMSRFLDLILGCVGAGAVAEFELRERFSAFFARLLAGDLVCLGVLVPEASTCR